MAGQKKKKMQRLGKGLGGLRDISRGLRRDERRTRGMEMSDNGRSEPV